MENRETRDIDIYKQRKRKKECEERREERERELDR